MGFICEPDEAENAEFDDVGTEFIGIYKVFIGGILRKQSNNSGGISSTAS